MPDAQNDTPAIGWVMWKVDYWRGSYSANLDHTKKTRANEDHQPCASISNSNILIHKAMSNYPNQQKLQAARLVLQRFDRPNITIGELDLAESSDLQQLMGPIEDRIQGRFCKTIELIDDEEVAGKIKLVFAVKTPAINGKRESDADGDYWESEMVTEQVTVIVRRECEVSRIVADLESEVRGIQYNMYAFND